MRITIEGNKGSSQLIKKQAQMLSKKIYKLNLDEYAKKGLSVLMRYTPKDTGKTTKMWEYAITTDKYNKIIKFYNKNIVNELYVALLIELGHKTVTGKRVKGLYYITREVQMLFVELEKELEHIIRKEVRKR